VSRFFVCGYLCGVWRLVAGFAPVALPRDRRRTSQNRFFEFCNPTSVITEGSVFIFVRRATPVARERAPTGQPAAHSYSTGSGVLSKVLSTGILPVGLRRGRREYRLEAYATIL